MIKLPFCEHPVLNLFIQIRMNSEDPILVRKRKIKLLQQEEGLAQTPPWKKELLRKKIDQVKEEIVELERQEHQLK